MLTYTRHLKSIARLLRKETTESEKILWGRLHTRQLQGVQFYRQKPLGPYIVDFYCASARLVIELDGMHHKDPNQLEQDVERDAYLRELGLRVLRFDNDQVQLQIESVIKLIEVAVFINHPL